MQTKEPRRANKCVVAFTVRPVKEADKPQIGQVYVEAFAEKEWNEFYKCAKCNTNYGKSEISLLETERDGCSGGDNPIKGNCITLAANPPYCSRCEVYLGPEDLGRGNLRTSPNLVPYWTVEAAIADLEAGLSREKPIALVAEQDNEIVGFTWGYKLPFSDFEFLSDKVLPKSSYMDEIAVKPGLWRKGIGSALCGRYVDEAEKQGMDQIVLRTLERFKAPMALYEKFGFEPVLNKEGNKVYEPKPPSGRIYLQKEIGKRAYWDKMEDDVCCSRY